MEYFPQYKDSELRNDVVDSAESLLLDVRMLFSSMEHDPENPNRAFGEFEIEDYGEADLCIDYFPNDNCLCVCARQVVSHADLGSSEIEEVDMADDYDPEDDACVPGRYFSLKQLIWLDYDTGKVTGYDIGFDAHDHNGEDVDMPVPDVECAVSGYWFREPLKDKGFPDIDELLETMEISEEYILATEGEDERWNLVIGSLDYDIYGTFTKDRLRYFTGILGCALELQD